MTASQDLAQGPLDFMNDNILIVPMLGNNAVPVTQGTTTVQIYSRPTNRVRGRRHNWRRTEVGVWFMVPQGAAAAPPDAVIDPNPLTVYFCPYHDNSTLGAVVSNGANLMFTTQMDGCSFGIGSASPAGNRLVYHTNEAAVGGTGGPGAQSNAQDRSLRDNFGATNTNIEAILAPNDYRTSRRGTVYKSTTFGVRNAASNQWHFFAQRFTEGAQVGHLRTFILKEVVQVL
ncbi:MAG: hypothetical protein WDN25_22435 [Acetobacteraceae bacterium]